MKEILSRRLGRVASYLRRMMPSDEYEALAAKTMDINATFDDLTNKERIYVRRAEREYDKANGTMYGG